MTSALWARAGLTSVEVTVLLAAYKRSRCSPGVTRFLSGYLHAFWTETLVEVKEELGC